MFSVQAGLEGQDDFVLCLPRPGALRNFACLFQEGGAVDQLRGSMLQKSGLSLVGFCHFHGA